MPASRFVRTPHGARCVFGGELVPVPNWKACACPNSEIRLCLSQIGNCACPKLGAIRAFWSPRCGWVQSDQRACACPKLGSSWVGACPNLELCLSQLGIVPVPNWNCACPKLGAIRAFWSPRRGWVQSDERACVALPLSNSLRNKETD